MLNLPMVTNQWINDVYAMLNLPTDTDLWVIIHK